MRQIRICIYGGTDLDDMAQAFISALSYQILNSMAAVIVTGGFKLDDNNPGAVSTDMAALEGASAYANDTGTDLKECFEAWIPEPTLDARTDNKEAERMTEEDGVTLRVMKGRTPLGRRLAMVAGVDFIVTLSGKMHTEVVIEQSLELGLPVLPIPDAGGDSKDLLEKHGDRVAAAFEPGTLEQCLDVVKQNIAADPNTAARAVVELIGKAKLGRCLILLPYDEEHNATYPLIEKAVARHMVPLRLDRLPRSDAIYSSFADSIRSSAAVTADITVLNDNVMYEIGYAHGLGLKPLLYTRKAGRLDDLPVYFRTLNVRLASDENPLDVLIDEYLTSFQAARGIHQANKSL
ncbi:MAG TPA: hypothetical protein VIX17_07310 [Pyrinomonadaceae bacterium]|jgi:hypothetical protein